MKCAVLTAMFAFAVSAAAKGAQHSRSSEILHHASEGEVELTGELGYVSGDVAYKGGGSSEIKGLHESVEIGYGATESVAVSLKLDHVSYKATTSGVPQSTTMSGIGDPQLEVQVRRPAGPGYLYLGADLSVALGKQITKANGDRNNSKGGVAFGPSIAYEFPTSSGVLGGGVRYTKWMTKRKETLETNPPVDSEHSGGDTLNLIGFYEARLPEARLGAALYIFATSRSEETSNSVVISQSAPTTNVQLSAYAALSLSESFTLIPVLSYGKETAYDSSRTEGTTAIGAMVSGRLVF